MKKFCLLLTGLLLSAALNAQTTNDASVEVAFPVRFKVTKPLADLIKENPTVVNNENVVKKEAADRKGRVPFMYTENPDALPKEGQDPALQQFMGTKYMAAPIVNWQGLSGDGTPPDPTGSAGLNHYMQAVNCQFRIYNKAGAPVTSAATLGSLLFGVNDGDPIVLYDKMADRWFFSQFGVADMTSPYQLYIAVSQTGDPTGSWYTYQYNVTVMPDYLKFSIWQDGYYMTANWGSSSQRVIVFERSAMLTGAAAPRLLSKTQTFPTQGSYYFFCPLSADADGELPPAGTPCPIFTYTDDGWGGTNTDAIKVYEMAVDWVPATPTATITNVATLAAEPFDASYNSSWLDVVQPGSSQKLDGIGGVFTYRAQHRCWTGYNTVVLCMGVKISASQRGIRWFELRKDVATGTWSIYQESTYTNADAYTRWCGSIAMDNNGSIGLAYNISGSTTVYPGIRYTGRNASDALGVMTYAEQIAQAGTSSQSGTERWGDYSHLSLDPSNGTVLWHTAEYYASGQKTRIYSFTIPVPAGIETANAEVSCIVFQSGSELIVRAENVPNVKEMVVDLFDINGRKIAGQNITPDGTKFETSFNVSSLAKGTYMVRIGAMNTSFQKVTKVVLN